MYLTDALPSPLTSAPALDVPQPSAAQNMTSRTRPTTAPTHSTYTPRRPWREAPLRFCLLPYTRDYAPHASPPQPTQAFLLLIKPTIYTHSTPHHSHPHTPTNNASPLAPQRQLAPPLHPPLPTQPTTTTHHHLTLHTHAYSPDRSHATSHRIARPRVILPHHSPARVASRSFALMRDASRRAAPQISTLHPSSHL